MAGILLLASLALACGGGGRSSDGLDAGDRDRLVIGEDMLTSYLALARNDDTYLVFLDPATGQEAERIDIHKPDGSAEVDVKKVMVVDVEKDTLGVFFYRATFPEDGLTPERKEWRLQTVSRATGTVVLDTVVRLPSNEFEHGGWSHTAVVGTDPRGFLVLSVYPDSSLDTKRIAVLPLRPGLKRWTRQEQGCCADVDVLAVGGGVVLVSRLDDRLAELYGYDVATGRRIWRQAYDHDPFFDSHPACAGWYRQRFVVTGEYVPFIVDASTGKTIAARHQPTCMRFDPLGRTGVALGGGLVGYDLVSGERLWAIPQERTAALSLRLVSVYDGRVYVSTKSQRLVLNARTGKEIARDWTIAPAARHDGWFVAYRSPGGIGEVHMGIRPTP